jgi:hypothetical protein
VSTIKALDVVEHQAHNLKAAGSNPAPATKIVHQQPVRATDSQMDCLLDLGAVGERHCENALLTGLFIRLGTADLWGH